MKLPSFSWQTSILVYLNNDTTAGTNQTAFDLEINIDSPTTAGTVSLLCCFHCSIRQYLKLYNYSCQNEQFLPPRTNIRNENYALRCEHIMFSARKKITKKNKKQLNHYYNSKSYKLNKCFMNKLCFKLKGGKNEN